MYKLLLCWRYLRTRYIALASIISVTLGVATMIVVNSVMEGFSHEMQDRIHGILSDVVLESRGANGFPDPEGQMAQIRAVCGDDIEGMTPTVVTQAMLMHRVMGNWRTRPVSLIGVDVKTHGQVSDFPQYLQHPVNRDSFSFDLREDGYDTFDHQAGPEAKPRDQLGRAGFSRRRAMALYQKQLEAADEDQRREAEARARESLQQQRRYEGGDAASDEKLAESTATAASGDEPTDNPFAAIAPAPAAVFDPAREQHAGVVLGIALASFRGHDGTDNFFVLPGDDVAIAMATAKIPPTIQTSNFTVVDIYESKMSEYDANFVFVPIEKLQADLGMIDHETGTRYATAIQIKCRAGVDGTVVRDKLRAAFAPQFFSVETWRDKQGPLLAAVQMETAILNVLLFMIIAVAGFGILAIFYMIVVEKTRDIGILKSLGAPSRGVMGIFLAYGLLLGIVGSGAGMAIGLVFVAYINDIADGLAMVTGQQVFDPSIYYFQSIPTIVVPFTVAWIVLGAMAIAVVASILPARRAARLHPVEALRYE